LNTPPAKAGGSGLWLKTGLTGNINPVCRIKYRLLELDTARFSESFV
jgi:hypothetical protein